MKKLLITLMLALVFPVCAFAGDADEKNYNFNRMMNVGGKIVSVAKDAGVTRVVIDILGEQNTVIVPAKAMPKDAASLKPGNFLVADGHPHNSEKTKMLADSVTVSKP